MQNLHHFHDNALPAHSDTLLPLKKYCKELHEINLHTYNPISYMKLIAKNQEAFHAKRNLFTPTQQNKFKISYVVDLRKPEQLVVQSVVLMDGMTAYLPMEAALVSYG